MSHSTKIYTKKTVDPVEICKHIINTRHYSLVIKPGQETSSFYQRDISTREVFFQKEKYGYDIRLNVLACYQDFECYRDVIRYAIEMSGGKAIYEGAHDITDDPYFFSHGFIQRQIKQEWSSIKLMIDHSGPITIFCPLRPFVIGARFVKMLEDKDSTLFGQTFDLAEKIRWSQYWPLSQKDTPVFEIQKQDASAKDESRKTICFYRLNEHVFVRHADYFALERHDEDTIIIRFIDLPFIVPESWQLIDEYQYLTKKLSEKEGELFWIRAMGYKIQESNL